VLAVPYAVTANTASNLSGTLPVAQLSGTVLNSSLPASPSFSGTVTANSFSGNGVGMTNVPGTVQWQTVQATGVQAQPNMGYLLTNNAQVTVTLPASPSMGDVTRITCLGSNGWSAALNQGQAILANSRSIYWNGHAINRGWSSVTSSTNGSKLVAVDRGLFGGGGLIYTSIDGGTNWIARESNREWRSVASSADGSKLVAMSGGAYSGNGADGGQIYTSTDSGVTWTARDSNRHWMSVASSADGNKLVAVESGGLIYTSTDSGATWSPSTSPSSSYVGAQYSSIELQYVGNGLFVPISHEGPNPTVY